MKATGTKSQQRLIKQQSIWVYVTSLPSSSRHGTKITQIDNALNCYSSTESAVEMIVEAAALSVRIELPSNPQNIN